MLSTIISVIIGVSLYNTIESIKNSIRNKSLDRDIEIKWEKFKKDLYYVKTNILRKEYNRKKDGI